MVTSADIGPHLPLLRRYARAITGTQRAGDAYVCAVVEAIVEDRSLVKGAGSVRAALYRLLTRVCGSNVATPVARQALLLIALEGFSPEVAACILDVKAARVEELVDQARRDLAPVPATDVLIVHPDTFVAWELERILEELGLRVIGVARTHSDVQKLAKARRPGLFITNTILADGNSSLDAVRELLWTIQAPVVVVTAIVERFLTGERPEPVFLVANPFQPTAVSAIVSQALFFERNASAASTAGWR